jgi:hypothetical protein
MIMVGVFAMGVYSLIRPREPNARKGVRLLLIFPLLIFLWNGKEMFLGDDNISVKKMQRTEQVVY